MFHSVKIDLLYAISYSVNNFPISFTFDFSYSRVFQIGLYNAV